MSLKPKKSQIHAESLASRSDNLSGPWGRIKSSSGSFDVVRFCQGTGPVIQKTHSYPHRVLSSWHWTKEANEEELKIEASGDLITVKGRGLDRIVEALDRSTLEILREMADNFPAEESPIWISSIKVPSLPKDE